MTATAPMKQPAQPGSERRNEPRFGAEGEVTMLVMTAHGEQEVRAQLVDFSLKGLRIRHEHAALSKGDHVQVFFSWGDITTEVKWNTPLGKRFEAGLQLF